MKALLHTEKRILYDAREAVEEVIEMKSIVFEKVNKLFKHDLKGKIVAVWGLA